MEKRSPVAVFFLPLVTLGIYSFVWCYKTAAEMRGKGAEIPSFIYMFLPILPLVWMWKWAQGVALVTGGKLTGGVAFALVLFLGNIGAAIIQSKFNEVE